MEEQKEKGRAMRRGILYGVLGTGAMAALFAARPIAAAVQGGGWHRLCGGRFGHHRGNPEAMREHAQVAVKWALREVDATEEQQTKVAAIVTTAMDDVFKLKERHQGNREAFVAQLGGSAVNREALEEVRKSEVALADEASRRIVQALADAAEVLTPEQRAALLDHAKRMHRSGPASESAGPSSSWGGPSLSRGVLTHPQIPAATALPSAPWRSASS